MHLPRTLTLSYIPVIFVVLEKSLSPGILIYEMECFHSLSLELVLKINKGKFIRLAYRHQVFVSRIMTVEELEWVLGPLTPTENRDPFFILQCAGRKRRHHILLWAR